MSRREKSASPSPGTHGGVRCYGTTGSFLVSQTHHRRGLRIGPHEHEAASLNFVLQGCYDETFRSTKEGHSEDTLLFKPGGARHKNQFDGSDAKCLLIEIDDERLNEILGKHVCRDPLVTRDPRLSVMATRILHEVQERDESSSMIVEELSIALFQSMENEPPVEIRTKVLQVEELLRETYRQPWSLSGVAQAVEIHPAHLGRAFRARFGCTVGEFVRHLRVLQVVRELRDSDKPIAQIALETGFADQSHCTRVFRSLVHDSPGRFRARSQRSAGRF